MDATTKKAILIVEDELFLRDLYQLEFEQTGMTADVAGGGREGLSKAKEKKYDGILLDIMMPDLNGLDVLKSLKQDPATKDIPVIFLTNMGQENVVKQGMELGAIGYMIKSSYTPDQLIKKVTELLNEHSVSKQPQQ